MDLRPTERRLAAILAGDVAGYSRLMTADEDGTLAQLKAHRRALVDPKIKEHRGKIIKTTGDGMLVEFSSVVDAVRCAVEIQRGMAERNAGVPADKRIEFRIGINLGDIIHDEKDIFGDGVNIAARLEGLAEPGGICVSQGVRDPVRDRLRFTFEDMGEQALKNIASPIHAYRVRFGGAEPGERTAARPLRRNAVAVAALAGLVAAGAVAAIGLFVWHNHVPPAAAVVSADAAPLPLPDKPSVAVLPFTNIGGDAKQERLADGITEDVITDLSRYRNLFVIARNSVFTYKGKAVSVQQVGRELGVRYVLEGSIQTSGDRVRVTAQLIEAATNTHVWSDRYDRPLNAIFELQNEVTQKIAAAVGGTTGAPAMVDLTGIRRKPPANLGAYDYERLGTELYLRATSVEESYRAEDMIKKGIEFDPQFARLYFRLGWIYNGRAYLPREKDPPRLLEQARIHFLKAIEIDPDDALIYSGLGTVYFELNDFDNGLAAFDQAFILNPNDPAILALYGEQLAFVGRAEEGIRAIDRAYRLNPHYPKWYDGNVDPFYATGRYDEVIARTHRNGGPHDTWHDVLVTMSFAQLGRQSEVAMAKADLLRRYPDFSLERALSDYGTIKDRSTLERYMDGVRKAGLNDCATEAEMQKYPKMTHLAVCDARRAGAQPARAPG
jgi:TolB-like protein/class 3 adenylate cyclase